MQISVHPPRRRGISSFTTTFALKRDTWNDHGFETLYQLYFRPSHPGAEPTLVGHVKILKRGQTGNDPAQLTQPFDQLGDCYCSVGTSLDYYQRLNEITADDRRAILDILRDVVANPTLQNEFKDEDGWHKSLFRYIPDPDDFLLDADAILTGNFSALPDIEQEFTFKPAQFDNPLLLNFDAPEAWESIVNKSAQSSLIPRRIVVLIGRNGSGKSTLLSRLARVAFAAPYDRTQPEIESIGSLEPASIGFTRIIAISYSAFDNFIVPGLLESELIQIAADIELGRGRYIYAGLRDIVAEVRDDVAAKDNDPSPPLDEDLVLSGTDRRTSTRLKSLSELAKEFGNLVSRIQDNGDTQLFEKALAPILADPSFAYSDSFNASELIGPDPVEAFLAWSTGHKIALHAISSLVAYASRRAFVLFDEPEMHLHPPLSSALLHSVRIVLEAKNAFAIVATHSPVIVQETLSKHVRIIRRSGDNFDISAPQFETFGDNIGSLTYNIFGLTATATDFHKTLDKLIERCSTIDEINSLFSPQLSGQALAYVLAAFAKKGQKS